MREQKQRNDDGDDQDEKVFVGRPFSTEADTRRVKLLNRRQAVKLCLQKHSPNLACCIQSFRARLFLAVVMLHKTIHQEMQVTKNSCDAGNTLLAEKIMKQKVANMKTFVVHGIHVVR